jgi:putative ABC transport system substrate-binding protein
MSTRRDFIMLLGGAAAWPVAARAQQVGQTFRIGMLETISAELNATNLAAFRRGLHELGYAEGRNLILEYRSADGDASRFPALISELIGLKVDLIVARGTPAALAVKQATRTIPVIMAVGEPLLIVDSLARPGGNITGLSGVQPELETKRLELLTEIAPGSAGVAALLNMGNPVTAPQLKELERAARLKGLPLRLFDVRARDDIERTFRALDGGSEAVVVGLEALTQAHRKLIAELAVKHRLPAIYGGREFVDAGGLMFYGPSFSDIYYRCATYADKIFRGTKPADLPVEQPTRFELIVNVRVAKALGLEVPATLLARADEVIE